MTAPAQTTYARLTYLYEVLQGLEDTWADAVNLHDVGGAIEAAVLLAIGNDGIGPCLANVRQFLQGINVGLVYIELSCHNPRITRRGRRGGFSDVRDVEVVFITYPEGLIDNQQVRVNGRAASRHQRVHQAVAFL